VAGGQTTTFRTFRGLARIGTVSRFMGDQEHFLCCKIPANRHTASYFRKIKQRRRLMGHFVTCRDCHFFGIFFF